MDLFLVISKRIQETIHSVLGWVSAAMLVVITLFALVEIVRRYLFDVVFEWGQDAIVVGMIAAVSLYFCVTQVRRSHLIMDAIIQLLHSRGHFKAVGFARILVSGIVALFCTALAVTGLPTLDYAIARELSTYSLIIPLWPFYLILIIGFGLMGLVAFLQMIEDIIAFARGEHLHSDIELTTDV